MTKQMSSNRKWSSQDYIVYENGVEVFKGSVRAICRKLDITPSNVCHAASDNRTVRRRYKIVYADK